MVAVYPSLREAGEAVNSFLRSEFDMKKVSLVGKELQFEETVVGYYTVGNQVKYWGEKGAFWGSIWRVLVGWAFFFIPGVGTVLVAGPMEGWILKALEDAAAIGGLSVLGTALYGIDIPKDSAMDYETAIKEDKFLLIVYGVEGEIARARDLVKATRIAELSVFAS